jgi:hypothetical protein
MLVAGAKAAQTGWATVLWNACGHKAYVLVAHATAGFEQHFGYWFAIGEAGVGQWFQVAACAANTSSATPCAIVCVPKRIA